MTQAADQGAVGDLHESRLESHGLRKPQGSYYTPPDIAARLVELTLSPILKSRKTQSLDQLAALRVIDPACGTGNILLAVARRIARTLLDLGMDAATARQHAYGHCVVGIDLDPNAAEICRTLLHSEAEGAVQKRTLDDRVFTADALIMPVADNSPIGSSRRELPNWPVLQALTGALKGFDLVVGNPPFLSQLSAKTAHNRAYSSLLQHRFGQAASAYTNPAALFLLLASEIANPNGGVVALLQPVSTLSAQDVQPVRETVLTKGSITALWVADQRVFNADVDVCAPVITIGSSSRRTDLLVGRTFRNLGSDRAPDFDATTWSSLLATSRGAPKCEIRTERCLGEVAEATADFRDQYYGLAPHIIDLSETASTRQPPLITAGLIDPAECRWGDRKMKFNKSSYQHPRVKLDDLPEQLQSWANSRLVPKVLLATQTRVLEAVVDVSGEYLPSVPVVTITSNEADLFQIGALLVSPPITLIALRRHLGTALSSDALRLRARDVLKLPLPLNDDLWAEAGLKFENATNAETAAARRSHLIESGGLMCEAFAVPGSGELIEWWTARLPRERNPAETSPRVHETSSI